MKTNKLKVINLYGGPCSGKSTLAAQLFAAMKVQGYNVEYVTEFAKELVYKEDMSTLSDQLYVFATMNNRLNMLKGKVDYVVIDSPLLLSLHYGEEGSEFDKLVVKKYQEYTNYDFFLEQQPNYQQSGRLQTEKESSTKSEEIWNLVSTITDLTYLSCDKCKVSQVLDTIEKEEGIEWDLHLNQM